MLVTADPLFDLLAGNASLRDRLKSVLRRGRLASVEDIVGALSPLVHDAAAMADLRRFLYDWRGPAMSVARDDDHEVLRDVAVLLQRGQFSSGAEADSVSVRYSEIGDGQLGFLAPLSFSSLESAAAFLRETADADDAGLGAVIESVKGRVGRPAAGAAEPGGGETDPVPLLAPLILKGDLAVARDLRNDGVIHFYWPRRGAVPEKTAAPSAPAPRKAATPPPPQTPELTPLPVPSGAAPATCDCVRNAAASGTPFVAAA